MRVVFLTGFLIVVVAACAAPSLPSASTSGLTGPSAAPTVSTVESPAATPVPSGSTAAAPTPEPTAASTPKPTAKPIAICLASMLKAKVTGWEGAAGSRIAGVTLTNTSKAPCTLQGTPEVELVDAHGAILIDSQTGGADGLPHVTPGATAFRVDHDGSVKTEVRDADYCGAAPALLTTVAFVLPSGGGRLVAAPGPGGSTPPCNSAPGSLGLIEMNGWTN